MLTVTAGSLTKKITNTTISPRRFPTRYRDRGQKYVNLDRAKSQLDCRIRYRALLGKNDIQYGPLN